MTEGEDDAELPVGVFLLLRELIRDRIGVSFEDNSRDLLALKLRDRLRARGLRAFLDYFYVLKYGPAGDEWDRLTDALSVQETYFWRELDQVRAFVDVLVPQHVAANRGPLRVWSAACATGEEPFSLCIALNEAGWFERADVEVWASDVSPAALEKAQNGVYRERSFRALPPTLREKYFTPVEGGWRAARDLHSRIRFVRANLMESADTSALATAPFIFCRNVFIYFSAATVAQVVRHFADRMPTPGYLFPGVSESLLRVTSAFQLEEVGKAFVYVKRNPGPGAP